MDKIDGRCFPISTQEERRRIAVQMRSQGSTLAEIKQAIGMSHPTIIKAWKAYQSGGKKALQNKIRGCRKGERRHLSQSRKRRFGKKLLIVCQNR